MKRSQKTQQQMLQKEKFARTNFPTLQALNKNQSQLLHALKYKTLVVAQGSAGTGKTLLSCWHASKKLHEKSIQKIVLIRAYQPLAGRTIGFLPGELKEKLMPYYQQMIDYLEDYLGKGVVDIAIKNDTIEICSLETIRGRSWSNTIVIVDEAQSLFIPEVQALCTRIGENSQLIFCGDNSGVQTDVKNGMDGLTYLQKLTDKYKIEDSEFITFTRDDIVRSGLTKEFVIAFEEELITKDPICTQAEVNKQFKNSR